MNRTERVNRIEELACEGSDLDSFSADRMEFSELLFIEIGDVLNDIHGMDFSLKFWKLVVEDHLLAEVVRKDNLRENEWVGSPEMYAIVNFSNYPSKGEKLRNIAGHISRYIKSKAHKREIDKNLEQYDNIYIGFNDLPVPESKGENVAVMPRYYPLIFGKSKQNKRQSLNRIADRYQSLFMRNIIRRIPKVYVEYFHQLYSTVDVVDPEKKTLHVHLTDSLFETMLIAKYTEEGARLIWYQHGCYYGEVVHKYRGYFEHTTGEIFRTWGYTDHDIDQSWSAYRLEAFKIKMPDAEPVNKYDLMICYAAIGNHNRTDVIKNTRYLLENLDRVKYKTILARPRPVNSRVNASDQLKFISDSRVKIAPDGTSIAKQVAQSNTILQLRVPSTNFLECIYCDRPVTGLLKNNQPTDIIKPYYDFFLETGILHPDIESATTFLNSVDVDTWWKGITGSSDYKMYKKMFANSEHFEKSQVK